MKLPYTFRPLLLLSLGLPLFSPAVDIIKTWDGDANNALNNISNWNNDQRPTFGAAANTDALLFPGTGTGVVNVNVDATAKSILVSGTLGYSFQGAFPLRLGDTSTGTVQPNSGFFINNSTANLALTTTGGVFFSFGKLEAAGSTISVGANSFIDIGNGATTAGRNLTITGPNNVTISGLISGLGNLTTPGGHLIKQGAGSLILNGSSAAWNGRIFLDEGAIRINRATSLGSAVGDTVLAGGLSTGKLELSGSISLDERLIIAGRATADVPLLVNVSGNNILTSPLLLNTGGTEYALRSDAGVVHLQGAVDYGTSVGATTLHLQGEGAGEISGIIGAGGDPLGVTKTGFGTWSLSGANAFTGAVQINAGRLDLTTAHAAENAIVVADGATLGLRVTEPGQSIAALSVDLSSTNGVALAYDLGSFGNPSVPVLKTSALNVTGVVGVTLKGGGLSIGQIPLIDYSGSIGGAGFAGLQLSEVPARVTASLVDDVTNGLILLNVTGFDLPRWTGEINAIWDINDGTGTGTTNWREVNSGALTRYLQGASSTDSVIFDDTASGTTTLTLSGQLSPASIRVNNTDKTYTFSGPGHLEGSGSLTKDGTGSLIFTNTTPSTFTGTTAINAGTVQVGDGITALAGSLGNGPILNEGTLVLNRPDAYTLGSAISGSGSLLKLGAGTTTLSGNSNFTSEFLIQAGTLRLANANALGDTAGATVVSEGAALDLNGQLLPENEILRISGSGIAQSGALINTGAGGAGVGLKKLVLTGPASIGGSARWDIRESPGGVNAAGYDLTKTGSNVIQWHNIGETHVGNLFIIGASGRLTLGGNTTAGDRPGEIRIESGAQLGLEESTVPVTKPIFSNLGTINATGGTTNAINSTIHITDGLTVNSAASTEIILAGKITGTGGLTKTTTGIVKITHDANDYSGATTISQGAFWIGNDGPTGNLPPGEIINNGNLIFRRSGAPLVISQKISGIGQITLPNAIPDSNDYVVTLSGDNTFEGNVTIRRAFLKITNSHALGKTLPPAAEGDPAPTKLVDISTARRPTLVLDGSAGDINLAPTILFNTSSDGPTGAIFNQAGNNIIQGSIDLTNGGGGNTRVLVSAGSLTLAGPVRSAATATSARGLLLDGPGSGFVTGVLSNGGPFALTVQKLGAGTWVLDSANTYTGNTTVTEGTLKIGVNGSLTNSLNIDLATEGRLDVTDLPAGLTLAANQSLRGTGTLQGTLHLGSGTFLNPGTGVIAGTLAISQSLQFQGGTLQVGITSQTSEEVISHDSVNVGGDLVLSSPSSIEIASTGVLLNGSYRLINYTGALMGDLANLAVINPTRFTVALDSSVPGAINLNVGGSQGNLVWSGNGTSNLWDRTTPASWNAGTELFYQSDAVTFDDTSVNTTVNLSGVLTPSSVVVSAAQNYVFGGTGSIGGFTGLTKSGTGSLTLNTAHSFTGKVKINAGSIILGAAGRLNGTRWIEVDEGALLDAQAVIAGITLGGTEPRIISGRGTLTGNYLINGVAGIRPGASSLETDVNTAGDGIGTLHFGGNLTLGAAAEPGFPRAVLRLAGPTGLVVNPLDPASVAVFSTTIPTQHDYLAVTGTLALDAGSTIRIELQESYTPALGDVFNLADWASLNTDADANGTGFNPLLLTDLELPPLPVGLYWNRSLFLSDGLLFISPEPPVVGDVEFNPANTVNPETEVTASAAVTGLEPYTYQWKFNNTAIPNATAATYTFTASEAAQGNYTVTVTNPAGSTTSAPAVLTVNDPVGFASPPANVTVNPGADAVFTVQVSGTGPFFYRWWRNGSVIPGETEDTLTVLSVTEEDQGDYQVEVTNVVGTRLSNAATLSVNDPVTFIVPPTPQGGLLGGSVTFSVQVAGTGPFTYRWRKNGTDLTEEAAAQPTYTLNNLLLTDEGNYSVRVTNVVGTIISEAVALVVAGDAPKVITLTPHQLRAVGSNVLLQVNAIGRPPLTYQWYFGAAKVAGGTNAQLSLNNAQLKNAGTYRVEISSAGETPVSSAGVELGLVDTTARTVTLASGGATKLDVKAAGVGLTYAWKKDDVTILATERITGVDKNILSLGKPLGDEDSGLYQLVVSGPGGTLTTLGHRVSIFSGAPVITENPPIFPAAIVGGDFTPYTIQVDADPAKAPLSYSAIGLPPGLKLDAKTGRITGRPTAVSKDPLGYLVKLTATNSKGKSTAEGRLIVQALPDNVIGSFAGPIGRNLDLNNNLGGLLELTVTKTGAYTGKLTLGSTVLALKGALLVTPALGETASTQTLQQTVLRKALPSLDLSLTFDAPNNRISTGQITDGSSTTSFTGWRNVWTKTRPAPAELGAYHTFALEIPETSLGVASIPQGSSYGSFTVKPDGKLAIVGKLSDGEALTFAGFAGPQGEIALLKTLYKTVEKGSIAGSLDINRPNLAGTVTWNRPATPSDKHRVYRSGFPGILTLAAIGGEYTAPISPLVFLNQAAGSNVTLSFLEGGLEALVASPEVLDIEVSIDAKNKSTVPLSTTNPSKVTLTLAEKTGVFKGSFNLENPNPLPGGKPALIKQSVKFEGIAIWTGEGLKGVGFQLIQQLPSEASPSATLTQVLSGQVTLKP
ncbi:immunoglobulin domain-containing protein [Prosthecobacter dejongeii]|uniref:Autotransporter-associated beta strand protein n=1 Tax=Prosthecobacter dejongeii TaxID=48465 RepID=A0A7W8DMY9_9BACT|nr:immunoglobulin domain-containing protein [Prosthecobacter dejongeii]MBB5035838.1 autotransporter-associated beta strand protein [Prosthecobacter dejongeii]